MTRTLTALVLATGVGMAAQSQTPRVVITGTVIEGDGRAPVWGAAVVLTGGAVSRSSVLTNEAGQFVLAAVPGVYRLGVTKSGYLPSGFGRRFPDDQNQSLTLTALETARSVEVRLWRPATIAGVVHDDAGEPVVGAEVVGLSRTFIGGRPTFATKIRTRTDDRGEYRLTGLEDGAYAVAVLGATGARVIRPDRAAESEGAATFFHPSSTVLVDAQVVTVAAGEQRSAIDVRVTFAKAGRLTGRVTGPTPCTAILQLWAGGRTNASEPPSDLPPQQTTCAEDGTFSFGAVPPGSYAVRAVAASFLGKSLIFSTRPGEAFALMAPRGRPGEPAPLPPLASRTTHWGEVGVVVEPGRPASVSVALQPLPTMAGRLVFEGSAAPPLASTFTSAGVLIERADGRPLPMYPPTRFEENGTFETPGFEPGRYVLHVRHGWKPWTWKTTTVAGRDISRTSVDTASLSPADLRTIRFVFTDATLAMVTGTVRDAGGRAMVDSTIYVFPIDEQEWFDYGPVPMQLLRFRPNDRGSFSQAVREGRYYVVAVTGRPTGEWGDPAFLRRLAARATRLTVGAAGQHQLDLVTQRVQ